MNKNLLIYIFKNNRQPSPPPAGIYPLCLLAASVTTQLPIPGKLSVTITLPVAAGCLHASFFIISYTPHVYTPRPRAPILTAISGYPHSINKLPNSDSKALYSFIPTSSLCSHNKLHRQARLVFLPISYTMQNRPASPRWQKNCYLPKLPLSLRLLQPSRKLLTGTPT